MKKSNFQTFKKPQVFNSHTGAPGGHLPPDWMMAKDSVKEELPKAVPFEASVRYSLDAMQKSHGKKKHQLGYFPGVILVV